MWRANGAVKLRGTFIKENNHLFNLSATKELTYKGFNQVTPEQWRKLIDLACQEFEDRYWHKTAYKKKACMNLLFVLVIQMVHPVKVASPVMRVAMSVINTILRIYFCCYFT